MVIDDNLEKFALEGALSLPVADEEGYVYNEGAKLWYGVYGTGLPVVLLHGGLGNSRNWGYSLPELQKQQCKVILMDSRGHGRSTRALQPYSYELMSRDLLALLDTLKIEKAALVGWSDGADTALVFSHKHPERTLGVFFFGCNMDNTGTLDFKPSPILDACFSRHVKDYQQLSKTPDAFDSLLQDLGTMQRTQPNYTAEQLAEINVPVTIVQSEFDEFIKPEHAEYLAKTIKGAEYVYLEGVSHFAPLQRPQQFNMALIEFIGKMLSNHF